MTKHGWITVVFLGLLAGCATSFTGSAYVEDGRAGCERKCAADGLEFSSMVYMGEYSSACVCKARGGSSGSDDASAAVAGGAAGVVMQMRNEEEQRQSQRGFYR